MTLIDLFREFSHVATVENYPKSARLLYYTMLYYWNEQKRPDVARLPHAQLYTLAGLPETSYREAFKFLADAGWVKRVKARTRAVSAWRMRDWRVENAPPACFPMSHARQSKSEIGKEESPPKGDSSEATSKAETNAHVRTNTEPNNSGDCSQTQTESSPQGTQPAVNDEIFDGTSISAPVLEL